MSLEAQSLGYNHHLLPRAERANQTVTKLGRASLLQSLLPQSFYNEAQQHAVFTKINHFQAPKTRCRPKAWAFIQRHSSLYLQSIVESLIFVPI